MLLNNLQAVCLHDGLPVSYKDGDRVPGTIFSEGALMVGNKRCARGAQCPAGYEGQDQKE